MAKARAIAKRRQAVGNIRKITHTMQLIATARYQQALRRAMDSRPYTDKITELVQQLSGGETSLDHKLAQTHDDAGKRAVLLLTSNRGFCGGYNANLIRNATAQQSRNETDGYATELHLVGKKGAAYFNFLGTPIERYYDELPDAPTFAQVERIASWFIKQYEDGRFNEVRVVYMKYLSAAKQTPETIQLLPISAVAPEREEGAGPAASVRYDFSPEPKELLDDLLPVTVKVRMFQCFCDAAVSENVARMVAMKSATDAATDMTKLLGRQFNRARQSQITMELLDIMGGVEALK